MKSFTAISAAAFFAGASQACSTTGNVQVTFYGYPDNSPPSAQVAHNCGGRNYVAGGSGSYSDPLTFATAPGEFDPCEIIYLPLLKKYVRYEDDCAQCESDWKGGKHHIDIWTGSAKVSGGQKQIDCEDDLTTGGQYSIVRQPPNSLEVDSSALFDNGNCNKKAVYESNQASCSGGSSNDDSNNSTSTAGGDDGNKGGKGASSTASGFATSVTASPSKSHGKSDSSAATTTAEKSQSSGSSDSGSGNEDGGDDDDDCSDDE